ncbi:nucleotidyltransferase domain-containing protein [Paenibacillus donghaensis]|uniref:Polymerase nucleotidyl transferase domain-containing protein n=1 Tax=Paenibacillus donghaensis TaxID=414771 RepID=A0A2Z2K6H9_9BACL|nr:nucleotidyltransferase domain-containing protein [Paenibacillus donghaensis]ASA20417.1 hypothetical protein B9T62_06130 [Paenibacillus donghaensis]
MYKHHQAAIDSITVKLKAREEVLGVIIGGSIAHGYANEASDLDIMLVLSEEAYERAHAEMDLGFFETESCSYEGGYVDGKSISIDYIHKVAEYGSEPARFAFKDAFLSYSKVEGLDKLILKAASYPVEKKLSNLNQFYAQFETWKWYYYEGLKRDNRLLVDYSLTNYVFFAGRLILAYNERLFPSYKWFLKELEQVEHKPDGLMHLLDQVIELKTPAAVEALYHNVMGFNEWNSSDKHWSIQFMLDSQLNWLDGEVPVLDL